MTTSTTTTEEELRKLYDECGGDLTKVAAALDLPYSEFVSIYGSSLAPEPARPPLRRPPPEDVGANLPPDRKFIVAVRHVDSPIWPADNSAAIAKARRDYELGTHEMIQGRDTRGWYVLYSVPRKKKTQPRRFFHSWA